MAGIFKAYDVRGIYPDQLDERIAGQVGLAFRHVLSPDALERSNAVVVSRDMRPHSEPLSEALIEGLRDSGLDVIDIGLATTPMNYFAVGHLGTAGGIQVTASHNPARYNGLKFSLDGARPVSGDHGIPKIESLVEGGTLAASGALDLLSSGLPGMIGLGGFCFPRQEGALTAATKRALAIQLFDVELRSHQLLELGDRRLGVAA